MSVGYKWKISLFPAVQLAAVVWGLACPLSSFGFVLQEDAGLCLSRLASCPLPSTLWPIVGPDLPSSCSAVTSLISAPFLFSWEDSWPLGHMSPSQARSSSLRPKACHTSESKLFDLILKKKFMQMVKSQRINESLH